MIGGTLETTALRSLGQAYQAAVGSGDPEPLRIRNRYYDAGLSTFVSRDPVGYRGGPSLYESALDNPVNRVDPEGLYTFSDAPGQKCNAGQKECITAVLEKVKGILQANGHCFDSGKDKSGSPGAKCREALTQCMLKTLESGVQIGCQKGKGNPGGAKDTGEGKCITSKSEAGNKGNRRDPKCPPDPDCNACSPNDLKHGLIVFDSTFVPIGKENCAKNIANTGNSLLGGGANIAHMLVHELLQFCVGGHTNGFEPDKLGRPDARAGAGDFMANCKGNFFPF